MTNHFDSRKEEIIHNLRAGVNDNSPRGHVDRPILELVNLINLHSDYYTTSSCSGWFVPSISLSKIKQR